MYESPLYVRKNNGFVASTGTIVASNPARSFVPFDNSILSLVKPDGIPSNAVYHNGTLVTHLGDTVVYTPA